MDKVGERLDKLAARQEKTDRQIDAIRTLLKAGMKMMVQRDKAMDARFKATDDRINALIDAQGRTERRLDRLVQALLGKGRNGR